MSCILFSYLHVTNKNKDDKERGQGSNEEGLGRYQSNPKAVYEIAQARRPPGLSGLQPHRLSDLTLNKTQRISTDTRPGRSRIVLY